MQKLSHKLIIDKFSLGIVKFMKVMLNGKIKRVEHYEKYKCASKDIETELQKQNIIFNLHYSKIGLFKFENRV